MWLTSMSVCSYAQIIMEAVHAANWIGVLLIIFLVFCCDEWDIDYFIAGTWFIIKHPGSSKSKKASLLKEQMKNTKSILVELAAFHTMTKAKTKKKFILGSREKWMLFVDGYALKPQL